jgi:hypothetical protein
MRKVRTGRCKEKEKGSWEKKKKKKKRVEEEEKVWG